MGILLENAKTYSGLAKIYLPFCPYFFVNVQSSNLNEEYNISYIEEYDISRDNHRLHAATESRDHNTMSNYFQIRMDHQDRFIKTTERAYFVSQKVNFINGKIENMRYIRLTKNLA